ncbi:Acetyltransferase, GNAT family [Clostridium bornimense]|uniref:Acetyltransferase, GNAT family n=1 Tax=Clostridium bornimense TaxID=1216932 RepID=W6RSF3_9CLOT|nr:GNAT family N-acetyltransferase [Clostridium bornimense]CDM67506.1 Acetyltransferase, GNAT family [Clostridium bornimense]
MRNIEITNGCSEDAPSIAALIYETEEYPEHEWGPYPKEKIIKKLEQLVQVKGNRYSYDRTKVIKIDNKVVGVLLTLRGNEIRKLTYNTYFKFIDFDRSFKNVICNVRNILSYIFFKECNINEYYIANLAVDKEYREFGIGKTLLEEAEDLAKEKGYNKISLLAKDRGIVRYYKKFKYNLENMNHLKMVKFI